MSPAALPSIRLQALARERLYGDGLARPNAASDRLGRTTPLSAGQLAPLADAERRPFARQPRSRRRPATSPQDEPSGEIPIGASLT